MKKYLKMKNHVDNTVHIAGRGSVVRQLCLPGCAVRQGFSHRSSVSFEQERSPLPGGRQGNPPRQHVPTVSQNFEERNMTSIKHDIWQYREGLTSLCFSGDLGEESRSLLEPDSKIIHSFYADSHFDAMTKYFVFMGWGKYETEFDIDKQPYGLENLEKRAMEWKEKK
ncbi:hypothetical protein [Mangrovibacterium diazotrophicum]|uniref:Uncharacterized protein n=1 Tax=Mangrovibacterium diazotrophicum TaxID=1261403 RepID=A0A419W408_9BACT|nr:hypothetical protein [Mangrovibacterium diazotrophicum]RKD90183.1 hypothetical protein BC643_0519 [Mangrovibacterium diazotrophicum]